MALIKFGGGILDMRGSIGGNTYARNRFGAYARARTKPTNPKTDRQNDIRASIAYLADRWAQTLDDAKRQSWNNYGAKVNMKNRLGETVNLTGFNHYIRSNSIRKFTQQAIIDDGPTIFELPAQDNTLAITASESAQTIDVSFDNTMEWAVETGGLQFLFQGTPQNPQRNFFAGPWRIIGVTVGVDPGGPATPHVRPVQFAIAELQRQWLYARNTMADGRLSEPYRADCFVAADGV